MQKTRNTTTRPKPRITLIRFLNWTAERDIGLSPADPGFCLACGAEADGCEPDARNLMRGLRS